MEKKKRQVKLLVTPRKVTAKLGLFSAEVCQAIRASPPACSRSGPPDLPARQAQPSAGHPVPPAERTRPHGLQTSRYPRQYSPRAIMQAPHGNDRERKRGSHETSQHIQTHAPGSSDSPPQVDATWTEALLLLRQVHPIHRERSLAR
jgi:hypothetical protein